MQFLNTILYQKEPELIEEMADSRPEQGKYNSCLRNWLCLKVGKFSRANRFISKGQKSAIEGPLPGQICDNLSTKKNNDRNHL